MMTIEERLIRAEVKLEQMAEIEKQLKKTQEALMVVASTADKNFAILSGRVSRKSDGFFSDLFNW